MPTWILASAAVIALLALVAVLGMYFAALDQARHLQRLTARKPR